ncbi:hypothetical protein [Streptomyces sp. NRRL F-2580]|uniref:hypothetical protein n=1 Tax=Streptomyces sp. NRRL F-2580 TaxID=1463841 RepID=UPI0004CB2B56|nr:hypothetical protein [Streptomyces sp. NRRL F-2580]
MNAKQISPKQLAAAAAQGVAIAIAARQASGEFDISRPVVAGFFPEELFEVTLAQSFDGQLAVENVQPLKTPR